MQEGVMYHVSNSMPIACLIDGPSGTCSLFMDAVTLPPNPAETHVLDQHESSMPGSKILSQGTALLGVSVPREEEEKKLVQGESVQAKNRKGTGALRPTGAVTKVQRQRKPPPEAAAAASSSSVVAPQANPTRKIKRRSQLTAAEKRSNAYMRVPHDFSFRPPTSCHHLLQEKHLCDPWRVLVICMLLNITTGNQVRKVLEKLFTLCPDAETTTKVDAEHIENVIRSLGLQKKRAQIIKCFSEEYLRPDWTHVTYLHGIGKYAADAYAIFCTGMGADVRPDDHKLTDYWNFVYGKDQV